MLFRSLDGGHISYAVLGSRLSTAVTFITVAVVMGLAWFASSWIVWTVLTVAMLIAFGPRHPRVFDEEQPLDRSRLALAVFAVAMFVLSFTPAPIRPIDVIHSPQKPGGRSVRAETDGNRTDRRDRRDKTDAVAATASALSVPSLSSVSSVPSVPPQSTLSGSMSTIARR